MELGLGIGSRSENELNREILRANEIYCSYFSKKCGILIHSYSYLFYTVEAFRIKRSINFNHTLVDPPIFHGMVLGEKRKGRGLGRDGGAFAG